MEVGAILIFIYSLITIIVRIVYHFAKDSNSKFGNFIYIIWTEWFEPPYYAMLGYFIIFLIIVIVGFMFR